MQNGNDVQETVVAKTEAESKRFMHSRCSASKTVPQLQGLKFFCFCVCLLSFLS